ncbi:hypothetical protein F4776DRAFT_630805 [Hypoxylon sp. NC0597]|nr:hypothetical protein F4776DRAFT_630805 [Hypoxylon sp. NC0597]
MSALNSVEPEALLNGPALSPPPGVIPQLDNPPSNRATAISVPIVCLVVSTLAMAMRLYTRIRIIRHMSITDYSLLLGWAIFVAYIACILLAFEYAPGVHQWDLRLRDYREFNYYMYIGSAIYGISIFFVKLSILMQYIQVFMPANQPKVMYRTTMSIIGLNFGYYLARTFIEIFACQPVAKAWDPLITEGRCIDVMSRDVASGIINTTSDFVILILPQLVIWRLNISFKNKTAVSVIFLIAVFACVSSAVRLSYAVALQRQSDFSYYSWLTSLWTLPEIAGGIVAACLPVAKAFIASLAQSRMFSGLTVAVGNIGGRSRFSGQQTTSMHELEGQSKSWEKTGRATNLAVLPDSDSVRGLWTGEHFEVSLEEGTRQHHDIY